MTTVPTRFRLRRDTAADWTSANPVLLLGEPGIETDTRKIKYGDGSTAWNSLAYAASDITGAQPLSAVLTFLATASAGTAAAVKTLLALVKGDVGLGNVDNTADTAKPVSTAQQTALDLKLTKSAPIEADVPIGSPVSMTTATAVDVCYIDLTVGTWLVTGNVAFTLAGGTTATIARGWMSATSATQPFPPNGGGMTQFVMPFTAGASQVIPAGSMTFTVASGTTRVYLSTRSTFSGGTMDAYGHILGIRIG